MATPAPTSPPAHVVDVTSPTQKVSPGAPTLRAAYQKKRNDGEETLYFGGPPSPLESQDGWGQPLPKTESFVEETPKIRPHRFGGEGVLIGVQSATLNAQVTFVYIAVAISALAGGGGPLKNFAPKPFPCWCFRNFSDVFWGLDLKRVLRSNFGSFWGDFGTERGETEQNSVHRDVLEGFRMSEQRETKHCSYAHIHRRPSPGP